MTACVIDGKHCDCQPDEGMACSRGTAAEVQAALNAELLREHADHRQMTELAGRLQAENEQLRAALAAAHQPAA